MECYAGLDVSLRSVAICAVDGDGNVVLERTVGCEVDEVTDVLRRLSTSVKLIGFEAEAMSQAEDVVAQAEAVAAAALADAENNEDDDGTQEVGEPA